MDTRDGKLADPDAYGHPKSRTKQGKPFQTNPADHNDSGITGKLTVGLAHSRARFRPTSHGNFNNIKTMSNVVI